MREIIISLILTIAVEYNIPPNFALAIALTENSKLNPLAEYVNKDGTIDRGIMQLNSSWYNGNWQDPETNIRAGINHIKEASTMEGVTSWWAVAVVYNAGYGRLSDPPPSTLRYAAAVMEKYSQLSNGKIEVVVRWNR